MMRDNRNKFTAEQSDSVRRAPAECRLLSQTDVGQRASLK